MLLLPNKPIYSKSTSHDVWKVSCLISSCWVPHLAFELNKKNCGTFPCTDEKIPPQMCAVQQNFWKGMCIPPAPTPLTGLVY